MRYVATVKAPRLMSAKAAYIESGADGFVGLSASVLSITLPELQSARHGSMQGGSRIDLYGGSRDGSIAPSIEILGVTGGLLNIEGFSGKDILESIANTSTKSSSGSYGEVLNFKFNEIRTETKGTSISGVLFGASLGVGLLPVDVGGSVSTTSFGHRIRPGLNNYDSLRYAKKYRGEHPRIDSIYNILKNRK